MVVGLHLRCRNAWFGDASGKAREDAGKYGSMSTLDAKRMRGVGTWGAVDPRDTFMATLGIENPIHKFVPSYHQQSTRSVCSPRAVSGIGETTESHASHAIRHLDHYLHVCM